MESERRKVIATFLLTYANSGGSRNRAAKVGEILTARIGQDGRVLVVSDERSEDGLMLVAAQADLETHTQPA